MNEENNYNEDFGGEDIFVIALIIFSALVGGLFLFLNIYHPIDPECRVPPGVMVDGGAEASVYTWHDLNGNGMIDSGEPPFPRVEIRYPCDDDYITDKRGRVDTVEFKAGCACYCWEGSHVEVIPPEGYLPTTPIRQELTGHSLFYSFGFIAESP
ncbi:hypothetical protein JR338_11455 [Chloroflexota bacterium]|nr:hypothetical protein JR338_11455 [Chloroflexota bacterium]